MNYVCTQLRKYRVKRWPLTDFIKFSRIYFWGFDLCELYVEAQNLIACYKYLVCYPCTYTAINS